MYAQRSAQEAYVESLQRMTVEQLIAEVMRVQIAAADLIKQEIVAERECIENEFFACLEEDIKNYQDFKRDNPNLDKFVKWIRNRGKESVTH